MGGRGKTRSSSRGRRRGRKNVKQGKKGEEDRISQLSDDLLNHILSDVDSNAAVQTLVLSKRWLNLWATLSCLNFKQPVIGNYENFVRTFLKNRDRQCVISKITIDCSHGGEEMLSTCILYAHPQNVEHLSICNRKFAYSPRWNFTCLKTLKLISSEILLEIWTLPSLTSLHLEKVSIFQVLRFENLKELALVENFRNKTDDATITIDCPKLRRLSLYPDFPHTFIVSAPSLSYLNYCSRHVSAFSASDGFPCIKQVHIDIRKSNGDFFDWSDWPNGLVGEGLVGELAMQNFISMLKAVRGTPFLELSSETIMGLRMIRNLSEYEHTSLGNLKFISLRGPGIYDMQPPRSTDQVIKYLLTNSPGAKIITS